MYRKVLEELDRDGVEYVHSQQLADARRRHAGPAAPRPGQLRHLRQHRPRLQRLPDEPHDQPHPRHQRDPDRRAVRRRRPGPRAALLPRASRSAASTSPWPSTSTATRSGRVFAGRRCYHVDELEDGAARVRRPHGGAGVHAPEGLQTLVDRVVRGRRARRSSTSCPSASTVAGRLLRARRSTSRPSSRCSRSSATQRGRRAGRTRRESAPEGMTA